MNGDQGIFVPLILGIVEGLTEFLPVSSTGHLLLLGHFLGFDSPGRTFEVLIQLGAILAIVVVYFHRLWQLARDAVARRPEALRFVLGVALASAPAALAGVLFHDFIKGVIYETPIVICVMLIVGGAFAYDLYKNRDLITTELGIAVALGFAAAFIIAFFVVKFLLDYVSRHGFAVFAYWRIFVGAIGLWGVLLFG